MPHRMDGRGAADKGAAGGPRAAPRPPASVDKRTLIAVVNALIVSVQTGPRGARGALVRTLSVLATIGGTWQGTWRVGVMRQMQRKRSTVTGALGVGLVAALALSCQRTPQEPPQPLPSSSPVAVGVSSLPPPAPVAAISVVAPGAPVPAPACGDAGDVFLFATPAHPMKGRRMRVVAVANKVADAQLTLKAPDGKELPPVGTRQGGPPYAWIATVDAPAAGTWHAALSRDAACPAAILAAEEVTVGARPGGVPGTPRTALWFTRAAWTPSLEDLYSAWIEHLFDAPLDAAPSWNALHEVLRDPDRNFLFDHLGAAEDEQSLVVRPDCADLPYFLRAYFAFKLGLPFGWSRCSRGDNGVPPVCGDFATSSDPFPKPDPKEHPDAKPPALPPWADPERERSGAWESNARRVGEFFRTTLADAVQSGAGRTPADDDTGDYYPVALSIGSLRPGTIFADPYGHVLVVARRVAQTPTSGGILLAVDGQPDGTVARKRFWRGNFLFAVDPSLGSAGFKRFRPIVHDRITGKWRHLLDAELPDYSTDQYAGGVTGFYDTMDDVLSPAPLDPTQALLETVSALEEQVKTRVNSLDNGRKFLATGKAAADMPEGAKIFEATGDWEDFSTPSRDLRILIAIDVARSVPARVARRPERYAMPGGQTPETVRAALEARLTSELASRKFTYVRTDGSDWSLRLQDVVDRAAALEMAYNPNDCVEQRWGAPPGSDEGSTCHAHAPGAQVAKMLGYRPWFHERRRPPR